MTSNPKIKIRGSPLRQSTLAGTTFSSPLTLEITKDKIPQSNYEVTFKIEKDDAGGTFVNGKVTSVHKTDDQGCVTSHMIIANDQPGSFKVTVAVKDDQDKDLDDTTVDDKIPKFDLTNNRAIAWWQVNVAIGVFVVFAVAALVIWYVAIAQDWAIEVVLSIIGVVGFATALSATILLSGRAGLNEKQIRRSIAFTVVVVYLLTLPLALLYAPYPTENAGGQATDTPEVIEAPEATDEAEISYVAALDKVRENSGGQEVMAIATSELTPTVEPNEITPEVQSSPAPTQEPDETEDQHINTDIFKEFTRLVVIVFGFYFGTRVVEDSLKAWKENR